MGRRHGRAPVVLVKYEVRASKDGYDIDVVHPDPKGPLKTTGAKMLRFVVDVAQSALYEVMDQLKARLKQLNERFMMKEGRGGRIYFGGTQKVLDLVEKLGYRPAVL